MTFSTPTPVRILIVDDHQVFTEALSIMFEDDPDIDVVGTANTSQRALSIMADKGAMINVVIMDIRLKGSDMNGLEAAEYIYDHYPTAKVLLLTMMQDGKLAARALQQNIAGYMLKDDAGADLRKAILKVYKGETFYSPDIMKAHMDYVRDLHISGGPLRLTPREREVLQLLVEEYSTSEIGQMLKIGEAGVETHRRNLRNKLDVKNTAGLVREALRRNLIDLDKLR